jgi:hypothetical protein
MSVHLSLKGFLPYCSWDVPGLGRMCRCVELLYMRAGSSTVHVGKHELGGGRGPQLLLQCLGFHGAFCRIC